MFTVERSSSHSWTVGRQLKTGKRLPVQDFPTKIEAIRHANKLNRESHAAKRHILDEETQLPLFDGSDLR
jgi:hypothetical protein